MVQPMPLAMLAQLLGAELSDPSRGETLISGYKALNAAGPGDLAFLWDDKYLADAQASQAAAIVCRAPVEGAQAPCLVVDDPQQAMLTLLGQVYQARHPDLPAGVHPSAYVAESAQLGEGVAVGPNAVVEDGAVIGAHSQVHAAAYVGRGVKTGERCRLHPHSTVLDHCQLGDRVTIWSGGIVGKDGFGFLQRDGQHVRIPQVGGVILGDDVEVGALSTVARGALEPTRVRAGAKIDDHCHVAHGCDIGKHVCLIGYARMGGSVTMGDNSWILQDGAVGVGLSVGAGGVVGSGAKARYKSVGAGEMVLGDPAHPHMLMKRIEGSLPKLPDMRRRLKSLERQVAKLADKLGE